MNLLTHLGKTQSTQTRAQSKQPEQILRLNGQSMTKQQRTKDEVFFSMKTLLNNIRTLLDVFNLSKSHVEFEIAVPYI